MHVLTYILRNLGGYKKLFYIVVIVSIINGLAAFYIPVSLAEFAKDPLRADGFWMTVIVIVTLYVISLVASYIVRGRGEALSRKYSNLIRLKYFRELAVLPISRLRTKHSGYVQSLVNRVGDGLGDIIFSLFWNLFPGVLLAILFFVYMARESLVLACANMVILAIFLVVSTMMARKMVPIAAEQNRRNAVLFGGFADFMANITTVAQLGIRPYAQRDLEQRSTKADHQTDVIQQFHARKWFVLHSLFGLAYLLSIGFLVWQISQGTASVGLLILFVSAYSMLRGLIERLSENLRAFMEIRAYIDELETFIGKKVPNDTRPKKDSWQTLALKDVAFSYQDTKNVISVPHFVLQAGQKVCIEGKSGQGKSTFLGLLTNSLQPKQGQRTIDTTPYHKVNRSTFETHVAVISQDTELFHLSVRDNILLGQRIDDKILLAYLDELGMREWCDGLKQGLDSIVGEKGITLSAGQRQRLNILRGVLLDRSLYVLDEPTSHLDIRTEELVIAFLKKHLKNKAAVIVTHRMAVRSMCDQAYEMKNHTLNKLD